MQFVFTLNWLVTLERILHVMIDSFKTTFLLQSPCNPLEKLLNIYCDVELWNNCILICYPLQNLTLTEHLFLQINFELLYSYNYLWPSYLNVTPKGYKFTCILYHVFIMLYIFLGHIPYIMLYIILGHVSSEVTRSWTRAVKSGPGAGENSEVQWDILNIHTKQVTVVWVSFACIDVSGLSVWYKDACMQISPTNLGLGATKYFIKPKAQIRQICWRSCTHTSL